MIRHWKITLAPFLALFSGLFFLGIMPSKDIFGQNKEPQDESKEKKIIRPGLKVLEELRIKTKDIPLSENQARDAIMTHFSESPQNNFSSEEQKKLKDKKMIKSKESEDLYYFGRWTINLKEKTIRANGGDPKIYPYSYSGVFFFEAKAWKVKIMVFAGPKIGPGQGK